METFLSELEEAMFLHDPLSMGESFPVKLGKILTASSIDELLHDIAKRRVREKSQWSLKNRINDLKDKHGFDFAVSDTNLEWMGNVRNNIIHNRGRGKYKSLKGQVLYQLEDKKQEDLGKTTSVFLGLCFNLITELYLEGAKAIGITSRFPKHRSNTKVISQISRAFPMVLDQVTASP